MKRFDVDLIIHTMFPNGQDTKHVGGYYIVRRIIPAVPHFIIMGRFVTPLQSRLGRLTWLVASLQLPSPASMKNPKHEVHDRNS